MTDPAARLLVLLFMKDLADFRKQVAVGKVREELNLPVFLVFASAQQEVIAAKRPEIDSDAVIKGLLSWWTTTWPFCD